MTTIRYTYLLLFLCLFAGARTAKAQCSADAVVINVQCFGQNNGSIDLTVANGTGPYTYQWSDNQTTEDLSNLVAGTYTCTVTDVLSCTATSSATVTEPTTLIVLIDGTTINCSNQSSLLTASVSGGVPPYEYLWSDGSTTQNAQIQQPGTFELTITDANGCTAGGSAYVEEDVVQPVACTGPAGTLTCATPTIVLDGTCSSSGPEFIYNWTTTDGNILAGQNTLTPIVNAPGFYQLLITNVTNGCTSTALVMVTLDNIEPLSVSAGPDLSIPCGGGMVSLIGSSIGGPNFTFVWETQNGNFLSGINTLNPVVNAPGTYTLVVTNTATGCTSSDVMVVTESASGLCSTIQGRVLQDTVENCLTDAGEPPLSGWILKAEGALGTYYAVTDSTGDYQLQVVAGDTYTISAIVPSVLWGGCSPSIDLVVTDPNTIIVATDLLFQKLAGCPVLSVDITSGNLRRCFSNNLFYVSYCNYGTEPAEDAYVDITLDAFLTPVNSSLPYTDVGSGVLRFEVGDLGVGQCDNFHFTTHLSCNAAFGQTHCTEAHIYPDSLCIPSNPQWSGASLRITSECASDSVRFVIENVGGGNMTNALEYIIIEDQVLLMMAPVQLDAGQSTTISVPANGSTWRLEVDQVAFHPGQSAPAVSVEGCTTGPTFTTGFVTQFPADDADEFVDLDCKENTASSDPNDKNAFPKGYGAEHYIRPGTPLEYLIRFQNTGNDTAFTVRVVDTLSAWLDPATFRPGASSHAYTWDLSGAGVLSFLYENILLPDSNVNEPASHGFVKFTINHRADASLETVIENTADIYFDFNDAIVTNTTFHRLGENFVTVGLWQPERPEYAVLVSPNPFSDVAILEVKGLHQNTPLHLQVFDLQGKLQMEMDSDGTIFQLKKGGLPGGVYLFKIAHRGLNVGSGKLIIQD